MQEQCHGGEARCFGDCDGDDNRTHPGKLLAAMEHHCCLADSQTVCVDSEHERQHLQVLRAECCGVRHGRSNILKNAASAAASISKSYGCVQKAFDAKSALKVVHQTGLQS